MITSIRLPEDRMRLLRIVAITLLILGCVSIIFAAGQTVTLTFERADTAGICGMRPFWDRPVVLREDGLRERVAGEGMQAGARAVWASDFHWDEAAAHWTTTVSYGYQRPGAIVFDGAQRSLLLRFPDAAQTIADTVNKGYAIEKAELLLPFDGTELAPLGYSRPAPASVPRGHAVAWLLRKPWQADDITGPTFNAYINGAGYWKQFGAQDTEADRYPQPFGPAEVSQARNERLDVTPVFTDPAYGATLGERLTGMEDCGFLISKMEHGGIGIFLKRPKLLLTLRKMPNVHTIDTLPDPPVFHDLRMYLAEDRQGGLPSALLPSDEEFAVLHARYRWHRPEGMPAWQWQHLQEVQALGGNAQYFPNTPAEYASWLDAQLAVPPGAWDDNAILEHTARLTDDAQALPAPVLEHWKHCWSAWLLPENSGEVPQRADDAQYRTTPVANTDTALGVLFGGHFLDAKSVEDAGRAALETFPLRLWSWSDGTAALDPASLSHLLLAQQLLAGFAPTPLDRLMGRSMLLKSLEEAASSYHPLLHRVCTPTPAAGSIDLPAQQDAMRCVLHILSPAGTLTTVGKKNPAFAAAPARVARASLAAPWTPAWVGGLIDHKPLPYEVTATCARGGRDWNAPRYLRCYLGHSYSLASIDLADGDTIPLLAQWRRTTAPTAGDENLGLLTLRDTPPSGPAILQYHNKLVALTTRHAALELRTRQPNPGWRVYVDEQPLTTLPAQVKSSSRITIKDGVSYLGIIPIPASEAELLLQGGDEPAGGTPALSLSWSLGKAATRQEAVAPAYGGFILEIADVSDYAQFADFQRHITQDHLELNWDAKEETLRLTLKSGSDTFELGYSPAQPATAGAPAFRYRRVNDHAPYLAAGIERDTPLAVQGSSGHLLKNDVELTCEPGVTGYVLTDPQSGCYAGYNPLPDPTYWALNLPGGMHVEADGRVSLLSVTAQPRDNSMTIEYAASAAQDGEEMATALLVNGMRSDPHLLCNGKDISAKTETALIEGRRTLIIPLTARYAGVPRVLARFAQSRAARQQAYAHPAMRDAELRCEPGQEHYLLSTPRSDAFCFQRLQPAPSVIAARIPGGLRVASDGRVTLRRLEMSQREHRIAIDLPPATQPNALERAHALLIFGADTPPALLLNGEPYPAPLLETQLNGEKAYLAPLFGATGAAAVTGIEDRYRQAQTLLDEIK